MEFKREIDDTVMQLLKPADADMRRYQEEDGRFYFSAAADLLLRKYGQPLIDREDGEVVYGLVTRGTPWREAFRGKALVFEGPLHPSIHEAMNLKANRFTVSELELSMSDSGSLGRLAFNRATLRRIPPRNSEISEPYMFTAEDPRWTPTEYGFESFSDYSEEAAVLFATDKTGRRYAVGLRRDNAIVFGVPILDVITQHHAAPPYPDGFYETVVHSDLEPLERWLVALCGNHFHARGHVVISRDRWPYPYKSAFTIRHDFDRPMNGFSRRTFFQRLAIRRLLAAYRRRGVRSTWFWRVLSYNRRLVRLVCRKSHEVALHTEAHDRQGFERETAFFRESGLSIGGYTAHGGAGSRGYLGHHQILWAIDLGFSYGELLGSRTTLPSTAFVVENDLPRTQSLVMPAQHLGLDISTRPDGHCLETLLPQAQSALSRAEHCLVMNHPDIHIPELIALIERLDFDGVWHATLAEIAAWSHATAMWLEPVDVNGVVILTFAAELPHPVQIRVGAGEQILSVVVAKGRRQIKLRKNSGGVSVVE